MGIRWLVLVGVLLAGLGSLVVRICADGGAMAAPYQSCECWGLEWELYDQSEIDGPRRTLCVGWVRKKTCYQFRNGPVVPCEGPRGELPSPEMEHVRLHYRIRLDAVAPSRFVALVEDGMTIPLEVVWDLSGEGVS